MLIGLSKDWASNVPLQIMVRSKRMFPVIAACFLKGSAACGWLFSIHPLYYLVFPLFRRSRRGLNIDLPLREHHRRRVLIQTSFFLRSFSEDSPRILSNISDRLGLKPSQKLIAGSKHGGRLDLLSMSPAQSRLLHGMPDVSPSQVRKVPRRGPTATLI